jgi:DNA-binding GntR family transcriptional regulator
MTMAFPFHTEASLALVSQNLEQLQATMNLETFMDRQSAFLRSLYEPGGYPFLLEEILKIVTRSQRYAALNAQILKQLPKDVPVPADIVSALKDGNLPLAQARLRRLYESSSALAASILGQQQIAAQTAKRRPRGRPRSVLS